eukprot:Nk52_evm1s1889 gene=Nk52_evmTU1s1889
MGLFNLLARWLGMKKKRVSVLCLGLDNAGKTTILSKLQADAGRMNNNHSSSGGEQDPITPTVGFKVNTMDSLLPGGGTPGGNTSSGSGSSSSRGLEFTVVDLSGAGRYRTLWDHFYQDCDAIIFVVDSADRLRLTVVKDELDAMLGHPDLVDKRIPVLFFANKMDLEDACTPTELTDMLRLDLVKNKPWHICASCGLDARGLYDAVLWLTDQIRAQNT